MKSFKKGQNLGFDPSLRKFSMCYVYFLFFAKSFYFLFQILNLFRIKKA